jgi:thioredoxin reductase (NADPH)
MRIVNPTIGDPHHATDDVGHGPHDWLDDPICMFTNSKPNATELLDGVRANLSEHLYRTDIGFAAKQNSARPASVELLDWLAQQYRIAVLAIGD